MAREAQDRAAVAPPSSGAPASPSSSTAAASGNTSTTRVRFRPLLHAPALVQAVRRLNLGVLPVACPAICYKRALNTDHAQLSHAAVLLATEREDQGEEKEGDEGEGQDQDQSDGRGSADLSRKRKRALADQQDQDKNPKQTQERNQCQSQDQDQEQEAEPPRVVGAVVAEHDFIHHVVHIQTLAVDIAYRRRGIARQLIERVLRAAKEIEDVKCLELFVHVANAEAQAFYEALGFAEYQRLGNYYRRLTPSEAIVLRREL